MVASAQQIRTRSTLARPTLTPVERFSNDLLNIAISIVEAFCFRLVDFVAFTAALTLILAHMDMHLSFHTQSTEKRANVLAHHRLSDRLLLEMVLEKLDEINERNRDTMSAESAKVLRSLVQMKVTAVETYGILHIAAAIQQGRPTVAAAGDHPATDSTVLEIQAPYFGTIRVSRGGTISKTFPQNATSLNASCDKENIEQTSLDLDRSITNEFAIHTLRADESSRVTDQMPNGCMAATAGMDQWAFQGVDTAFFDSLMMSMNSGGPDQDSSSFGRT